MTKEGRSVPRDGGSSGSVIVEEDASKTSFCAAHATGSREHGVLFVVIIAVAACIYLATRPSFCTAEEGRCSTSPCSCADESHAVRALATPEGDVCWQCVAFCPSGNEPQECRQGHCECSDASQERVLWNSSSVEDPCWRCTYSPIISLRSQEASASSCLVRAPRSKLLALRGVSLEPLLRLVLVSEESDAASCASFVREGMILREKNTSLCLSRSSSGSLWGLGKCAPTTSQEAQAQSLAEVHRDGEKVYCLTDAGVESCVQVRGHVCSSRAGTCTPTACDCEEYGWMKTEAILADGRSCWSCSPPATRLCSTDPRVCTASPCECEDAGHDKVSRFIDSNSSTCWSCQPQGHTSMFESSLVGSVGILLCCLSVAVLMRRLDPIKNSQASSMSWSAGLLLELEEIRATVEEHLDSCVMFSAQTGVRGCKAWQVVYMYEEK
ncbi:unnamed protein product, partial [Effrenium voratum]